MAQNSINIYLNQDSTELDKLNQILKGVVENIQVGAVSEALKNTNGSGNPEAGTIRYKRLKNATLNDKGTARTAGAGVAVRAENVDVNIDTDKEIVEELQLKDVKLYGIPALVEKRYANAWKRIVAFLDTQFFAKAKAEGTAYAGSKTAVKDIVDEMIVNAKSTKSDYIDGIDATDLAVVLSPAWRKALKNDLDTKPNGTFTSQGAIGLYDGIETFESVRLGEGVDCVVMLKGAIAQPQYVSEFKADKVPFDDAIAVELFSYSGTKALNPEAIYYHETSTSI